MTDMLSQPCSLDCDLPPRATEKCKTCKTIQDKTFISPRELDSEVFWGPSTRSRASTGHDRGTYHQRSRSLDGVINFKSEPGKQKNQRHIMTSVLIHCNFTVHFSFPLFQSQFPINQFAICLVPFMFILRVWTITAERLLCLFSFIPPLEKPSISRSELT